MKKFTLMMVIIILPHLAFLSTGKSQCLENVNQLNLQKDVVIFKVIDEVEYQKEYSEMPWMHIGRLAKANAGIDLKQIDASTDFEKIVFLQNKDYVYRLYDGNFLVRKITKQ